MGKRKKITLVYNGFHGLRVISFLVPADAKPGDEVEVSATVARRLNDEVCGIRNCKCGEKVAHMVGYHVGGEKGGQAIWGVTLPKNGVIRGKYPQG